MAKVLSLLLVLLSTTPIFAGIATGIDGHKEGDVIAVRTDQQIADWCYFDKQIVVTQTNVLCVYNGRDAKKGL